MRWKFLCLSVCIGMIGLLPRPCWGGDSLDLQEAWRLALAQSEIVEIAKEGLADSEQRLSGNWTGMGPKIDLSASGTLQREVRHPNGSIVSPGHLFSASGQITQPLIRPAFFPARDAVKAGVDAARATFARAREQLKLEVLSSFINVMKAREQVDRADLAAQRAEVQLASTRARIKAGGALRNAELLAGIELTRAMAQVAAARGELRNHDATFMRLVGMTPPPRLILPPMPPLPDLTETRADLKALHALELQAQAQIRTLKARLWPTLDLKGFFSYHSYVFPYDALMTLDTGRNEVFAGGQLALTIPLLQSGDEYVQIRLQKIRREIISFQKSLLSKQINENAKIAKSRLDIAQESLALAEQREKLALENYTLVANQFKLGAVTFLEVANSQKLLAESQILRVTTSYERELSMYQLLFVLGKLDL